MSEHRQYERQGEAFELTEMVGDYKPFKVRFQEGPHTWSHWIPFETDSARSKWIEAYFSNRIRTA